MGPNFTPGRSRSKNKALIFLQRKPRLASPRLEEAEERTGTATASERGGKAGSQRIAADAEHNAGCILRPPRRPPLVSRSAAPVFPVRCVGY